MTCGGAPARLTLGGLVAVGDFVTENARRYVVGSELVVSLQSLDTQAGTKVYGTGAVQLVDPQGVARLAEDSLEERVGSSISLHTLKPGAGVEVRFGGVQAPLPIELMDDAAFTLELNADKKLTDGTWEVRALPRHTASGEVVGGLTGCVFEARPASGSVLRQELEFCRMFISPSVEPGTVCVSVRGKTACTPYKR